MFLLPEAFKTSLDFEVEIQKWKLENCELISAAKNDATFHSMSIGEK